MIDIENMKPSQRAILNALVIGGISFFSSLATTGGIPTYENIWAGISAGALACLIRISDFLNKQVDDDNNGKKPKLGMVI